MQVQLGKQNLDLDENKEFENNFQFSKQQQNQMKILEVVELDEGDFVNELWHLGSTESSEINKNMIDQNLSPFSEKKNKIIQLTALEESEIFLFRSNILRIPQEVAFDQKDNHFILTVRFLRNNFPLFADWDYFKLISLILNSRQIQTEKGASILKMTDQVQNVYFILNGSIKIYQIETKNFVEIQENKEKLLHVQNTNTPNGSQVQPSLKLQQFSIFGFEDILDVNQNYSFNANAENQCTFFLVNKNYFKEFFLKDALTKKFFQELKFQRKKIFSSQQNSIQNHNQQNNKNEFQNFEKKTFISKTENIKTSENRAKTETHEQELPNQNFKNEILNKTLDIKIKKLNKQGILFEKYFNKDYSYLCNSYRNNSSPLSSRTSNKDQIKFQQQRNYKNDMAHLLKRFPYFQKINQNIQIEQDLIKTNLKISNIKITKTNINNYFQPIFTQRELPQYQVKFSVRKRNISFDNTTIQNGLNKYQKNLNFLENNETQSGNIFKQRRKITQ